LHANAALGVCGMALGFPKGAATITLAGPSGSKELGYVSLVGGL
jgi:hypothetical protein